MASEKPAAADPNELHFGADDVPQTERSLSPLSIVHSLFSTSSGRNRTGGLFGSRHNSTRSKRTPTDEISPLTPNSSRWGSRHTSRRSRNGTTEEISPLTPSAHSQNMPDGHTQTLSPAAIQSNNESAVYRSVPNRDLSMSPPIVVRDVDAVRQPMLNPTFHGSIESVGVGVYRLKSRRPNVFIAWWFEMFSWSASFLALGGLAILLRTQDGNLLADWSSFVALSTVIAILALIFIMGLTVPVSSSISQLKWLWFGRRKKRLTDFAVFDDASRGPRGGVILLARLRRMNWAHLGVTISILLLLVGPFFQQTVTYSAEKSSQIQNTITTQRAQSYGSLNPSKRDSTTATAGTKVSSSMSLAIVNGALTAASSQIPSLSPNCPNGNCDFPKPFRTLGICTDVSDVKSMVTSNCGGVDNPSAPGDKVGQCQYELGNNLTLAWGENEVFQLIAANESTTLRYSSVESAVFDFFVLNADLANPLTITVEPTQTLYSNPFGINAYEVLVRFCVQEISTNITDGKISNTVNEIPSDATFASSDSPLWSKHDLILTPKDNTSDPYTVAHSSLTALQSWGAKTYAGAGWMVNDTVFQDPTLNRFDISTAFVDALRGKSGTDAAETIRSLMDNCATSMTNEIRRASVDAPVLGTTTSTDVVIRVNWGWIVLPAVLLVATLVLLVSTVVRTHRRRAPVWKANALASLLCLDEHVRGQIGGFDTLEDVERKAGGVMVKLQTSEFGDAGTVLTNKGSVSMIPSITGV